MSSMISKTILSQLRNSTKQHSARLLLASTTATVAPTVTATITPILSSSQFLQNKIQISYFSNEATKENTTTIAVDVNTTTDTTTDTNADWIPEQFTRERPPSILDITYPNNTTYTTGQAWSTVQKHIAGGHQIRHEDFIQLCNSTQASTPKEAKLLPIILKDLKRCNRFILTVDNATLCVNSMYRSMLPNNGVDDASGWFQVKCGLLIGESFINSNTGLYVSLPTDVVEQTILTPLYHGLKELQQTLNDDADADADTDTLDERKKELYTQTTTESVEKGMNLSNDIFNVLLTRATVPTNHMKKRAKRKYLTHARCSTGPTPSSIDLMVRICLLEGETGGSGSDSIDVEKKGEGIKVAKSMLEAFEEKGFLGSALEETSLLVKEAEDRLSSYVKELEKAAEEGEEAEGDESGTDEKEEK